MAAQIFNLGKLRFTYQGAYSGSTEYQLNDVVGYNNNVYVYINTGATTGNAPSNTAYWGLMMEGLIDPTTGNGGQLLSTDGTNFEWADIATLPSVTSNLNKLLIAGAENAQWATSAPSFEFTGDLTVASSGGVLYTGVGAETDATTLGANVKTPALKSLTANVVTLTTTANHGFAPFQKINVALVPSDPRFDGVREILDIPSPTTLTYVSTNSDVNTTAVGGVVSAVAGYNNPVAAFSINEDDYAQIAFRNASSGGNASSDIIVYANNGTDYAGYLDMGITSSAFTDPAFTITGPNDGYIFMTAPYGTFGNGDLVLATGDTGVANRIIFAAGGLASNNTQMTITPDQSVHIEIDTPSTSSTTGALTVAGGVGISGDMNIAGDVAIVGSISFGGGSTTSANLAVTSPVIFAGDGAVGDTNDLGFVGEYKVASTTKYSGLARNSATGGWKLFKDLTTKPTTTTNFSGATDADLTVGSLTVNGGITISGTSDVQEMREVVVPTAISTNVATCDWTAGNIYWIGTAPSANFTVALTNVPTDNNRIMTVNAFVTQGATGYIPSAVTINGASTTIKWTGATSPTPTSSAGRIDVFTFTLVRLSSAWTVLGSANLNWG